MKLSFTVLSVLLFASLSIHSIAQDIVTERVEVVMTEELIELEGDEGRILVFPAPCSGPNGPVVRFVMFGVREIPEVIIDTVTYQIIDVVFRKDGLDSHHKELYLEVVK